MRFKDAGKMRNSVYIATDTIDPDPNQPRREFDEFFNEQKKITRTAATELSRAPEEKRKAIIQKAEFDGGKIRVQDVQRETIGRAAVITGASIDRLIKHCVGKVKEYSATEIQDIIQADKWKFGVQLLRCVLGLEKIDDI